MEISIPEKLEKLEDEEKKILEQIPALRKNLQEKYKIKVPERCNQFLERCLRVKDGNLEKAEKLVKHFQTATSEIEKWGTPLRPSLYDATFYKFVMYTLTARDPLGRRIYVVEAQYWDKSLMTFEEAILAVWMFGQYAVAEYTDDQENGFILILDFTDFSMQQAWAIKQKRCAALGRWAHSGNLGRVKGLHVVNHPRIISLIFSALKPFLSEKIRKRIKFHDNLDSLQETLAMDLKVLPKVFGGAMENKDCADKIFHKGLVNSDEYFQDMLNTGIPTK